MESPWRRPRSRASSHYSAATLADATAPPVQTHRPGESRWKPPISRITSSRRYNEDLERVRTNVLQMGGLVEQQLQNAVTALVRATAGSASRSRAAITRSTPWKWRSTTTAAASWRRAARRRRDLRLIVAVIKTITDLERIGDEAEKIGYIGSRLAAVRTAGRSLPRDQAPRPHLSRDMVHEALDAFARLDAEAALRVARKDRAGRRGIRSHPAPVHHVHDGRSAHASAARWTCCGSRARSSASATTPRTSASTSSTWCTARTSATSRSRTWRSKCSAARRRAVRRSLTLGHVADRRASRVSAALTRRNGNLLGFLACCGLMGYALYVQHVLRLEPCPLCIFQRVAVIMVGVAVPARRAAQSRARRLAHLWRADRCSRRSPAWLIAGAAHLDQAQPPGTVAACGADLDYMLDIMPVH